MQLIAFSLRILPIVYMHLTFKPDYGHNKAIQIKIKMTNSIVNKVGWVPFRILIWISVCSFDYYLLKTAKNNFEKI